MQRTLQRPQLRKSHGSRLFIATIATGLLVSALAVVTPTPASAAGCGLAGSGTPADPYEVVDAAGLALVGVEDCALSASYEQTANITLPSVADGSSNHTRIGSPTARFTGTYDGGGYEITGLRMVTTAAWPDEGFGLFGAVGATAVLSNIRLVDASVTAESAGAVGGLVGQNLGRIERSSVVGGSIRGSYYVGGLVGLTQNSCDQTNNVLIRESFSTAQVTGSATGYAAAGGLVGGAGECTTIERSFASGAVTGEQFVGGLVGDAFNVTIRDSYASGATTGTDGVGGLVGVLYESNGTAAIVRSHAFGAVSGTLRTGGLVGGLDGSSTSANTTASFWDLDTTGQAASAGGAGRTSAAMRQLATFADAPASWSIVSGWQAPSNPTWGICSGVNGGYPFLLWQFDTDPCVEQLVLGTPASLQLACDGPMVVGGTIACTVRGGDAGVDILWRAAYNPPFAGAGVTLDVNGSGTFSFVIPAAALGDTVTVELVAWTQPMTLGVVGGPVPASVPAGKGSVPFGAVLFALLAAAGVVVAGRRLVTAG
jgi:hypothetical protein